jgi:hypothetical protein
MNRTFSVLAIALLLVAVGFISFTGQSAAQGQAPGQAADDAADVQIGGGQVFFTQTHFTTSSAWPNFVRIPGVVAANNGASSRIAIVRFSSDAYNSSTTNRSAVRLSVDNGPCIIAGPELFNLSHLAGFFPQARTWQGVVQTGPGTHTYQMCGAAVNGGSVSWGFRDLTVESRTR